MTNRNITSIATEATRMRETTMTERISHRGFRRAAAYLLALGVALALLFTSAGQALALPPGGAQGSTPGTSSSVSPSTLTSGGTLHFTLRGFPAGEVVSVKIDDGNASSGDQSVQGQGVVHTQKIPSSGTVSGSFVLPSLSKGKHTLRFLASKKVAGKGTKGYTNKSPAFTISKTANKGGSGVTTRSGNTTVSKGGNTTSERVITVQRPGSRAGGAQQQPAQQQPAQQQPAQQQGAQEQAAQPGMEPGAQPGMDPGAQPGMAPGAQPNAAMPGATSSESAAPESAPAATIQPSKDPAAESQRAQASDAAVAAQSQEAEASSKAAKELVDTKASLKAVKAQNADLQHGFPWLGAGAMLLVVVVLVGLAWLVARRTARGSHEA